MREVNYALLNKALDHLFAILNNSVLFENMVKRVGIEVDEEKIRTIRRMVKELYGQVLEQILNMKLIVRPEDEINIVPE